MAQLSDFSTPMIRPAASLKGHMALRLRSKEFDRPDTRQLLREHDVPLKSGGPGRDWGLSSFSEACHG
jgi:hypothetical protein